MSVLVMEPLVVRGRAPVRAAHPDATAASPEPRAGPRPLTNRAAGRLRDDPDRLAFGGFAYTRTAQDDAEVAAALGRAGRPVGQAQDRPVAGAPAAAPVATPESAAPAAPEAPDTPPPAPDVGAATADATPVPSGTPPTPASPQPAGPVPAPPPAAAPPQVVPPPPSSPDSPAALVTAVTTAAGALPHPDVPRAPLDRAFAPLVATAGTRAARPLPAGGGGRYPPPRPVEPIEIDPVPQATAALSTALNSRLPELNLPALQAMPDGTMPTLPPVRGVQADELAVEVDTAGPAADATRVNDTERSRAAAATRDTPDPAAPPTTPIPVSPPVLVDFRRPPPPPLPQADALLETAQITRVLALVSANVDQRAQTLIDDLRNQAFPPNRMGNYYLDVTDPMRDQLRTDLQAKLGELREAAGISVAALDAAVATRRTELQGQVAHVATAAELEVDRTATALTREAERENARAEGQRLRDQARQVARFRRALHSRDPALVEELVTARLGYIDRDVGSGTTAIDAAKARRLELIGLYESAYGEAYRAADDAWQHPAGRPARAPPNLGDRVWIDVVRDQLATAMTGLRTQTENDAAQLANDLRDAGLAAKAAVRTWSDTRLRRTLSADERVERTTRDIDATNTAVTQARAQAARDATRERLVGEIRFATATYLRTLDDAQQVSRQHLINLTDEQVQVGRQYLAGGEATDPLTAVANNLVQQYARENLRERPQQIRDAVYAKTPANAAEAGELGDIYFPEGGGGLDNRVNRLWTAFEVWHGTAEEDAIAALEGLDTHQARLLRFQYRFLKGEDLDWRIRDEMSGADRDMALGLATGDRALHARGVIAASDGIFSNDPNRALDAIRNLPPGEAQAVVNDPETRAHLTTVLGGRRWLDSRGSVTDDRGERELQALVQINQLTPADAGRRAEDPATAAQLRDLQARADAIEFDRIVRRGTGGDAPSTDALFDRIRQSVTTSAPATWSADEIDNEVRRRIRAMENAYEHEFGAELPSGGVSAMRTAVVRYSWGTQLDLRTALLDVNRAAERSTRLQQTTEGFYTSDSELNTELGRTYRDALAEVRRNRTRQQEVEARAQQLMAADGITAGGRTPAPRELAAYRQEAEEELARILAATWMTDVNAAFADRYGWRWGGGPNALQSMVESETQFGGEREALDRLRNGGGLTAAQSVEHGVAGWGMDRDTVLAGIGNRTRQQLVRISADYRTNTGEDMETRLRSETGGWTSATPDRQMEREGFDVREALRGVATTPREEYDAARRRFEYERDVYFSGDASRRDSAVGPEFASLQRQMDRVDARMRDYEAAEVRGDAAAQRRLQASIALARDSVAVSADHYREAVDAYVDRMAQVAGIVAALAVVAIAAITTVLTGGAAAPVWIALAASIAGTAATMATKYSILGAAYSTTQLQTDLIVGVVDAIVTVLTARLGNILLRLPKPTGATRAAIAASARAIEAQRLTRPLLHRAAAFAVEQVAQSVPAAVTGALLTRDTWRGDPLRNIAGTAGLAAVTGIGVGAAMHVGMQGAQRLIGGAVDAIRVLRRGSESAMSADSVVLGSTRRALAGPDVPEGAPLNRGSWLERWAARREYFRLNPEATEFDFRLALQNGTAQAQASAASIRQLRAELVGHLLSGVSGPEAQLVRQTRIEVLPEAEFARVTGSESNGYAATLNIRGEPVVVIREGAPLSSLREEGLHVLQFFDPEHSGRLALLEEGRLARWPEVSVPDRIAAWQAKIDLELDVQRRMIPELEAELGRPGLRPEHAVDLVRRIEDAEAAIEVLSSRERALAELHPAEIARMQQGDLAPPRFLADEPRLFAKAASVVPGPEFKEGSRRSRIAVFYDASGNPVYYRLERFRGGSWQPSGRVNPYHGAAAELADRLEVARLAATDPPGRRTVMVHAQRGGPGFDNPVFTFHTDSLGRVRAELDVHEVKNYFHNTVDSFSAISDNFERNLAHLRNRVNELRTAGLLSSAEAAAALRAIDDRRFTITVRTTDTTRVNTADLRRIQGGLNRGRKGSQIQVVLDPTPIDPRAVAESSAAWETAYGYQRLGTKAPDNVLFRELANGETGMTPQSVRLADAVVRARSAPGSLISGTPAWEPRHTFLVDGANRPFVVHTPSRTPAGVWDLQAEARAILDAANRGVTVGASSQSMRVVVDYRGMTSLEIFLLHNTIRDLAPNHGGTGTLTRIMELGLP